MKKNIKKEYNLSLIEKKWPSFAPAELRKGKQKGYGHLEIEKKWQKRWAVSKIYKSKEDTKKKKFYVLDMFPYPSGEGLHVGHPKGYIATDVISRYQRMKGYSVLHPMGFDAFGLPAENYALKTKTNPADSVKKNVMRFKKQLELIGLDYDWSREINTTDPKYYKWTQWIFLQLFKKGLAYESYEPINWCPSCKTGLANEDVENGHCERCGTLVEKKPMRQWVLKITDYAERLLNDLDAVDTSDSPHIIDKKWPPRPGKKVVERRTIHALVRDPKTGKFLGLRWKKFPWTTFIVGGVELSEGAIEAAKREVEEETGYCNLKFMQTLGGPVKAEYYAAHKDQNRVAITTGVLFELASDEKKPVSAEEEDKHETIWMDPRDLTPEIMTCAELPIWLKRLPTASMGIFQGAPLFTQILEPGTVRTEIPSVERNAIMAIVKHWSKDKYIGLKWKKVTWRTLITGGPENGQTPEEGAIAEIMEETGYLHPKLIKNLGKIHSKFFHVPKNVNRFAHFDVLYFELKDGDKNEISGEEKTNHEVMWLSKEEMVTFLTPESHKYAWLTMFQGKEMRGEKDEGEAKLLLDWPESIKELQRNWIGKSEGTEIQFTVGTHIVEVFTTRPDTLFGVTYMVLAPEHKLVSELLNSVENKKEVEAYIKKSKSQTEIQRTDDTKEKTGVELKGIKAVNPANNEEVPVWIADYVLADYGTGAVMAVPAHDERDWDFAKKYGLPVKQVIAVYQTDSEGKDRVRPDKETVKRKTVYALLFDEKNDRFLCLNWEKFGWHSGIIGGVDDGESFKDAAVREIREETGYVNIEYIKNLGMEQHNYFFAAHKDVNRYAFGQGMLFKLINEEKVPVNEEETKNHKTIWIKSNDMESWLDLAAFKFMWNAYKSGSDYFTGNGKIINSAKFNGMESEKAIKEISSFVGGKQVTKYKLRDWVFSRQRYWGEPIPLIHCEKCGVVPVPEKDLPVILPKVKSYEPTGTGESPLAAISKWVNVKCPKCKSMGKRETNTMPQWAGSCWYYLRYEDPKNAKTLVDTKKEKYWSPIDIYVGGAEHATRHLIYARFWHKFLFDINAVSNSEPFKKLQHVGLIMGEDGRKMSKRFGNVVNPDDVIKTFGADALRIYEMFMGPFDQQISWSTSSIVGSRRFVEKVCKLAEKIGVGGTESTAEINRVIHKTIKKVTDDIENMRFNTAISSLMILVNEMEKSASITKGQYEITLQLLAPFAPHITEELWSGLGNKKSIHISSWPKYDNSIIVDTKATIMIQVNGRVRGSFIDSTNATKEDIERNAKEIPGIKRWLDNKKIVKVIVVPNRLVNFVII